MKKGIIIIIVLAFTWSAHGQSPAVLQKPEKQVSFNMTTLTKKMLPFNVQSAGFQNYAMQFRKKFKTGDMYFTSAFGFNMSETESDESLMHFDTRVGLETQKKIGKKWYYGSGYNLVFYVHELEEVQFFGSDVETGVAFDKSFLIGYHLNDFLSIYTETSLQFGINSNTFVKLQFLSPNAIYLNVKF